MVALAPGDADAPQRCELTGSLDPFCDDSDLGLGGERHEGSGK